jgi:chromosome partitioning protein
MSSAADIIIDRILSEAKMAKIVAFTNQKGGVGKTTSCVNLAAVIGKRKKVLVCDCDPQGNATSGLGVDKWTRPNLYDVLIMGEPIASAIHKTPYCDLLPSNRELSGGGVELVNLEHREYLLKTALSLVKDEYDFIFIDCPPSLELLTINALAAADEVIIPVQCEYYALEGITDLLYTIELTRKGINPALEINGIILTMYDARTNFSAQVAEEIEKHFPQKVYKQYIPRNVRVAEAPSHGMPVIAYDRWSKGAIAYIRLAYEFLKRENDYGKGKEGFGAGARRFISNR